MLCWKRITRSAVYLLDDVTVLWMRKIAKQVGSCLERYCFCLVRTEGDCALHEGLRLILKFGCGAWCRSCCCGSKMRTWLANVSGITTGTRYTDQLGIKPFVWRPQLQQQLQCILFVVTNLRNRWLTCGSWTFFSIQEAQALEKVFFKGWRK